jgi:hypothetical protein
LLSEDDQADPAKYLPTLAATHMQGVTLGTAPMTERATSKATASPFTRWPAASGCRSKAWAASNPRFAEGDHGVRGAPVKPPPSPAQSAPARPGR